VSEPDAAVPNSDNGEEPRSKKAAKSLETWIWDAACSIRGAKDAPKYKDFILPLIFAKRLCDVFDDELNRIAGKVGSRKKAFTLVKHDKQLVRFYLPFEPSDDEQPVWSVIRTLSTQIGQQLTTHLRAIADANPLLKGIIDRVDFNATTHGVRDLDDDRLSNLIEAISAKRLGLDDVEPDIIGRSYEYLIRKFAEGSVSSAGEFYTPAEVGFLMARVVDPEPGMNVYDPCCGSAGLLIKCQLIAKERADGRRASPVRLFGQESEPGTWRVCRMRPTSASLGRRLTRPRTAKARSRRSAPTMRLVTCTSTRLQRASRTGQRSPLYYNLAPNDMLVPSDIMQEEFLSLAADEGIADIDELNKILDRAINLKNFLKGRQRVEDVAEYVADHYRENVEPLGYKAFLVAVDREACVFYKEALDKILPPEYSAIVFTGNNNDPPHLKKWHIDEQRERAIRKDFAKPDEQPKILIVTEKLLTGFDAPILYAMYLDKPMRDHTLLQGIARVNRPYEDQEAGLVKPHGFVLDFVGIFDKLEKALAFDSDEINAIIKDLKLLKQLFASRMQERAPGYLSLVERKFDDKDVDKLIEHFRDKDRREQLFKDYKELEMLYEIISPDAFLRPYLDDYFSLSAIYAVVANAYAKTVYVDRAFQRKTNELVQKHIGVDKLKNVTEFVEIDANTIELIKKQKGGDSKKVINLVKSIEKAAQDAGDDPFLIALADRARAVQEHYEDRHASTSAALDKLLAEIEQNERRKAEQTARGLDSVTYFVLCKLTDDDYADADQTSRIIAKVFEDHPNWYRSEAALREARQEVTFALVSVEDDVEKVTRTVGELFALLRKGFQQ
jgi:N-6 DNA Methylase/HsdM N-terminal domain/UvrB domain 3